MERSRMASMAAMSLMAMGGAFRPLYQRRGEKYPGQRQAFRVGAWPGDGIQSKRTVRTRSRRTR